MELLAGRLDRPAAEACVNLRTAQLAKRQRTWFRHQIESIRIDGSERTPGDLVQAARDTVRSAVSAGATRS
jgi:tRNA A37 N6-isopentenylltransferase MiaA